MEEEMQSVISSGEVNNNIATSNQVSDSNKRKRSGSTGGGSSLSSKFKGLIRQRNGHWSAQLYTKHGHSRIWLGTFKSETDAAMAYDSAAMAYDCSHRNRNFPWTDITDEEQKFQSYHSPESVLSMIRDGSYQHKFKDFLKAQSQSRKERSVELIDFHSVVGTYCCKQILFQKELTPSDVGKINRLVIPKRYAVHFFQPIIGKEKDNVHGGDGSSKPKDAELLFFDKWMKLWKFRYFYCNSSRSFVFTKGWSLFLKEKQLKAKYVISFYVCESKTKENQKFYMIDVMVLKEKIGNNNALIQAANLQVQREVDLQLQLAVEPKLKHGVNDTKGFKLFGIEIEIN